MNIISKLLFPLFIFLFGSYARGQETDKQFENAESILVNEWSLNSFEINGQIFPPREKNKNDRMIFYADKSVKSISSDKIQKGVWSYDKISHILIVVDQNKKFDMQLKLISITNSECVLELENPKENFVKLHMIKVK